LFACTTRQGTTPTSPATTLERRRLRTDRHDHTRTVPEPEPEPLAFLTAEHPLRDKHCGGCSMTPPLKPARSSPSTSTISTYPAAVPS
ncbi:MAG: hypothetical protein ACRDQ6_16540, partial [Pseudonocardiaceae bacterium]